MSKQKNRNDARILEHVYFVIDVTDFIFDEGPYYHVGIFSSYANAENWLLDLSAPVGDNEIDEVQHFEIRKIKLNKPEWSGEGKIMAKAMLTWKWTDNEDTICSAEILEVSHET